MTGPDPQRAPMDCDSIAKYYRWLEYASFGPLLERARFHWIGRVADAKSVLILGDGDGRFIARYAAANPEARIDSIDLSAGMLKLAERRLGQLDLNERPKIRLIRGDALTTDQLHGPYDLVIANFFLDCLDRGEQQQLIEKLTPETDCKARWLVTDFQIPMSPRIASIFHIFTKIMYFFFRVTAGLQNRDLPDFFPLLASAGYRTTGQRTWLFGYLFSDVLER